MTSDEMRQIADSVGGARKLASILMVGKDWVYRRLAGKAPITYRDTIMLDRVDDVMEYQDHNRTLRRVGKETTSKETQDDSLEEK